MLKRLDRSDAVGPVLEQFRQAIESGHWPPGSQIPTEGELVSILGVGRGAIREALATLKAFGLVEAQPGRGTFVTRDLAAIAAWPVAIGSDNRELLEARYGIDAWINCLAARKATPEDIDRICAAEARMRQAVAEGRSMDELVALDGEFHAALAGATHNSVLARLNVLMAASLDRSRRANISTATLLEEAIRSHQELAEAVKAHDAEEAFVATRRSLRRVARLQGIDFFGDEEDPADRESCDATPAQERILQ